MTDIRELFLAIGIAILTIVMLIFYSRCAKKFTKITFGALSGVAVLYPVQFLVTALGGVFSFNLFTVCVSAVLGIPGVILLSIVSFL